MQCDLCDKPAVVHEVTVKDGVKNEIHLCEEHASAAGISIPGQQPINELLNQFVVGKSARQTTSTKRACRGCGTTFASFRQSGLLGCPDCYDAFDEQLGPMIERAQNGGASHAGKCPGREGESTDRKLQIRRLFKELEEAIAAEEYERAAKLRDQLRDLDPGHPAQGGARTGAAGASAGTSSGPVGSTLDPGGPSQDD